MHDPVLVLVRLVLLSPVAVGSICFIGQWGINLLVLSKGGHDSEKVLIEAIPILYYLGKVSVKRLYRFKSQKFWAWSDTSTFYAKKFESARRLYRFKPQNLQRWSDTSTFTLKHLKRQSNCIVSDPGIFKGEAIQVLLLKKIWIYEVIVSLQNLRYYKVVMCVSMSVRAR